MSGFDAILLKDFVELRRDRLALLLIVVLPVLALALFGFGIRMQSHNIALSVIDLDKTSDSARFIDSLIGARVFGVSIAAPDQTPESLLQRGSSVVMLPRGFASDISRGAAHAQFFIDASDLNQARAAEMYSRIVSNAYLPHPKITGYYIIPAISVWFNPSLREEQFIVPGSLGVLLWMFPSLLAAVATARELERASSVQLYVSKMAATTFIASKLIVYLMVGLLQAIFLLVLSYIIFDVRLFGVPPLFLVCSVIYISCSVLFGIWLGALARSQTVAVQAVSTGGFFPSLLLSGFVYPLENVPFVIQLASYLVPARYYIQILHSAFNQGATLQTYALNSGILLIFCIILFALTWKALTPMRLSEVQ
jgi:ABC-2 type transport system permease protein